MAWVAEGLVSLFFLVLIGQYTYREAKKEGRSSPELRGVFWIAFGVVGVVRYLVHLQERDPKGLAWVGLSGLLFALWAIGTLGCGD
ncbi:hypothetical protein ACFQJ5_18955 [Halomicroarcula sp. GCM10025324]|uniref:hypothetical protein n=1 Tax=Halomicroarcula sp. GCM10025324 TaxID=3252667 RepID=UPI00360C4C2D